MLTLKAFAILIATLSTGAPALAGATPTVLSEFASHSYLNGSLELSSSQRKELSCLTKVIWFEARGESKRGKTLVANVVQNRMKYGKPFATTVCDVVYQRNQFAWTRDTKKKQSNFLRIATVNWKTEKQQILDTVSVAMDVVIFNKPPQFKRATHFCSIGDKCRFQNVRKLGKVGGHTAFEYLGNK